MWNYNKVSNLISFLKMTTTPTYKSADLQWTTISMCVSLRSLPAGGREICRFHIHHWFCPRTKKDTERCRQRRRSERGRQMKESQRALGTVAEFLPNTVTCVNSIWLWEIQIPVFVFNIVITERLHVLPLHIKSSVYCANERDTQRQNRRLKESGREEEEVREWVGLVLRWLVWWVGDRESWSITYRSPIASVRGVVGKRGRVRERMGR